MPNIFNYNFVRIAIMRYNVPQILFSFSNCFSKKCYQFLLLITSMALILSNTNNHAISQSVDETIKIEDSEEESVENPYKFIFRAGAGARMSPEFRGASNLRFAPTAVLGFTYLNLPYFWKLGSESESKEDKQGFGFFPSIALTSRGDGEASEKLEGLRPINLAFELGLSLGYRYDDFQLTFVSRRGFGGHKGVHAKLGLRYHHQFTDRLLIYGGPYISVADTNFMNRFFGVTEQEAMDSPNIDQPHEARAGLRSAGLNLETTFDFTDKIRGHLGVDFENYLGDAATSPIVKNGSAIQISGRIGLSYKISIELYDYLVR